MKQLKGTNNKEINNVSNTLEENEMSDITTEDVKRQIKKLKKRKAAGEDGIPNEAWTYGNEKQIEHLKNIINNIWKGKGFPERWRTGLISPIYKQGDRHDPKNYRGITLLDTAYKIYASILEEKLTEEVEIKEILPENQVGFRRNRSTMDNIYVLNYIVQKEIHKKEGRLYEFFADLKAAFDRVNREKMIQHLTRLEIRRTER